MNLQQLCAASHVTVYFDAWNTWLYVDWEGDLTLPAVQQACLEMAHCFTTHAHSRVLCNNANLTSVDWNVAPWVVQHFLPYLRLAGIEQMAWVYAPGERGRDVAREAIRCLPATLSVALFSEVEQAVAWLQQTRPSYQSGSTTLPHALPSNSQLIKLVQRFEQELREVQALVDPPLA